MNDLKSLLSPTVESFGEAFMCRGFVMKHEIAVFGPSEESALQKWEQVAADAIRNGSKAHS